MSNVLTFQTVVQTTQRRTNLASKAKKKSENKEEKERGMYRIRTPAVKKSTLDHRSPKAYLIDFTDLLHGQTEVLIGGHHTNGVGVAHTATPSLDADNGVALVDDSELETVVDTPLEATVDILLPDLDVEVGLALGEVERPHTAVQVGVLETIVSK